MFGSIFVKDEATKEIDKIEKKSDDASKKMTNAFGKIGKAVIAAFSVTAILAFGKTMVETTAKIQALDSQFTQTFKNNGSQAMELITQQAKEQGINVDRLKGTWSSFYGTFRGNGADANQSLELTNKYMRLAADGAAYYDLSLEDVSSRLKSLVMGNFEAGDAIGVNINATKMDIKAKEEYGKAWKDLTDTEKEYLLINTVGKIYENSGAMGQGAREANNLTNVTENLKATWGRFLSIIGSPVLGVVVSTLQSMTNGIMNLATLIQQHQTTFNALIILIGTLATAIGTYNLVLNWATISTTLATAATTAYGAVLGFITSPISIVVLAIGALIAIFTVLWKQNEGFRNFFIDMWEKIKAVTSEVLEGYIIPFIQNELVPIFQKGFQTIGDVVKGSFNAIKWAWENILRPIFINVILPYIQNVLLPTWRIIFNGISEAVTSVFNTIGNLWNNSLKPIFNGILDFISGIFTSNWQKAWQGVVSIFDGIFSGIVSVAKAPLNAVISLVNGAIRGLNRISVSIPDWVPGFGGRTFGISIPEVPMLAKGGTVIDGDAIVGEAGAELLRVRNGKATVIPLNNNDRKSVENNKSINVVQNIYVPVSSPSEIARKSKNELQRLALNF